MYSQVRNQSPFDLDFGTISFDLFKVNLILSTSLQKYADAIWNELRRWARFVLLRVLLLRSISRTRSTVSDSQSDIPRTIKLTHILFTFSRPPAVWSRDTARTAPFRRQKHRQDRGTHLELILASNPPPPVPHPPLSCITRFSQR